MATETKFDDNDIIGGLYTGVSSVGKIYAIFYLFILTIISLLLVGIGISMVLYPNKMTEKTTADIVNTTCITRGNKYECNVTVTYTASSGDIIQNLHLSIISTKKYKIGDTIDIFYNKDELTQITHNKGGGMLFGLGLIMVGIILESLAILYVWATRESKAFAALQGGTEIASAIGGIF